MKDYISSFLWAWVIILMINQIFIFNCLKPYCIMAGLPHTAFLAFLYIVFIVKDEKEKKSEDTQHLDEMISQFENDLTVTKAKDEKDYLKEKGDLYEKFIGKAFEKKGNLVIYNGLMRGYDDDGVDIIVISQKSNNIHLIQCKNWTVKPMYLDDIKRVYSKLKSFNLNRISKDANSIQKYLQINKSLETINNALNEDKERYTIRYTLYISSQKVVDLNLGTYLKLIKDNIFRYEDMKIVVKAIS